MKKTESFGAWLKLSLQFIYRDPIIWLGYTLFMALLFMIGRISLALGIFLSVCCLFVGVGIAKYIDSKSTDQKVSLSYAIHKSLPLAILAASVIVVCWFIFMVLAAIYSGDVYKIVQFFFHWEFTPENINRNTTREVVSWLYGYANVALIFSLLMVTTFASWFSHSLMLFKGYRWSLAKEIGNEAAAKHQNAIYKSLGFIFFEAVLCMSITPLLTPVLFVFTSIMLYVSYRNVFELDK